ncbi:hypothetical protein Sango_2852700 [Sesamum angolense]|uniref:Uncharacterized protein n=1 Tax=Sesamum angolense TaxID=2727404 RepID=A0AAE1T7Q0_9LAMI|nr:hypothetical protein Sango_2852700 [Sesamum angolense]
MAGLAGNEIEQDLLYFGGIPHIEEASRTRNIRLKTRQKRRNSTILDWPPSHDLERKRSPCYYKASKLLPQGHCCVAHGDGVAPTSIGPWFDLLMRIEPQRGMPSTRALLTTNHSLAGRSGSAFQVRYPNRLLSSTGSLAPSSILSTALLLGSILLLQPLAVIACFSGGSHPGWCG